MNSLSVKSYGKINIGLQIRSKRMDGFHNIHTVFQQINFFDTLIISKQKHNISFKSNVSWLKNDNSNLCIKAFKEMKGLYNLEGININLLKKIPICAGLGGGSSNAAAILKGVNLLYNLRLSDKELECIGSKVGADVSFFIKGGTQLGEGVGEKLKKVNKVFSFKFLLVMPKIKILSSWAYQKYKIFLDNCRDFINLKYCLEKDNIPFELFDNDFEKIVIPAYPEIGKIIKILRESKARYAGLSGSGSTVFGIFDDEVDAISAESFLSKKHKTIVVEPI